MYKSTSPQRKAPKKHSALLGLIARLLVGVCVYAARTRTADAEENAQCYQKKKKGRSPVFEKRSDAIQRALAVYPVVLFSPSGNLLFSAVDANNTKTAT